MIDKLKEIKASLQEDIEQIEENGGDMSYASWGIEEGVLISGEDAKVLVRFIDAVTDQKNLDAEVLGVLNKKFWDLI